MRSVTLEKEIGQNQTIVVDSTMDIKGIDSWMDAVTQVVARNAYVLIPRSDGSLVRSPNLTIPKPLVICLNKYVPRYSREVILRHDDLVSKKTILTRDNWTCQYCGLFGDTVDHIMPKSRGGGHTWGNLVAACTTCNGAKANLTPKEAGLTPPIIKNGLKTYAPRKREGLQEAIFQEIELLMTSN